MRKKPIKSAWLQVKVEPELRDEMMEICEKNNMVMSKVIRSLMRDWIAETRVIEQKTEKHLRKLTIAEALKQYNDREGC
jgi:antitoxin component of RelBE/YafQ-DinJ toxin-antitoxin module